MKKLKRNKLILLIILSLMLVACTQQPEKKEKITRPTINVKLQDGTTKKIDIEEYVTGVVAGEMHQDWPVNAYAAQAIKARTFAMKRLQENGNNTISAEHKEAQKYNPKKINSEIKKAVENTIGKVAMYEDDYIKGWFHSSAGGRTTTAKVGLAYKKAEPPYIKSVESPDDEAPADIKNWNVMISKAEIIKVLNKAGETANQIKDIKILNKDKTGRIVDLEIIHDQGSKKMKGAEFRTAIGPDKLKSTLVRSIQPSGEGFTFIGSGYGHGVGMSQWGVYKLAKQGKSPEEIIKFYFKGVEIEKKWD